MYAEDHVDAEKKVVEKFTATLLYTEKGDGRDPKKRGSTPEKVKSMFDDMNPDDLTNAMRRM